MKFTKTIAMLLVIVFVVGTLSAYSILPVYAAEGDDAAATDQGTDATTDDTAATDGTAAADGTAADDTAAEDMTSYEMQVARYLSNKYYTPTDKLSQDSNMKKWLTQDGYTLYANEMTGEVAIGDNTTGQVLFTNPYDVGTAVSSNDTKKKLLSQLVVKYLDNGTAKTFYSYTESAVRDQITIKNIKNGIRVEYSIGREEARALVPRMIKNERFMEIFYEPLIAIIEERRAYWADQGLDVDKDNVTDETYFECTRFLNFYIKKDKDDPDLSTRAIKEMIAKYPIVSKMAIWATDEQIKEKELLMLEQYIKKYIPGYSYEDLDTDHAITNYVGQDKAPALFRMALEYTVDENGLSVRLPAKGLRYDATNYQLESVSVLPYMGAGEYTNDGYTFLPDGSGALFRFEDFAGSSVNITSKMYGQDYGYYTIGEAHREVMRLPVFGVSESINADYDVEVQKAVVDDTGKQISPAVIEKEHYETERGYLAIIEAGDAIAELTTEHGGSLHQYCTAYTSYRPRPSDSYDISDVISAASSSVWTVTSSRKYVGDIKIKYLMLTGDKQAKAAGLSADDYYENSYVGMAKAYREYLEGNGTLTRLTKDETGSDIPLYLETFGTLEATERILSVPVTVKKALTTFDNIKTMYNELADKGVKNINFKLTGFTNGGMYATGPTKVNWESAVGGESGFKDLVSYAEEKGFGVYPDFNFTEIQTLGNFDGFSKDYLVKTINGRYTMKQTYDATLQQFMYYGGLVVSGASYDAIYEKFNKGYSKYNWGGVSVSTLDSDLSTDFDEDDPYNREDAKTFTADVLAKIDENYSNVMAEGGNVYGIKYVDHLLNAPIDSSRYTLSSDTVPFLGMVYHGYVNFAGTPLNMAGDYDYALLKTIENGASLYYMLSYTNTQVLKDYWQLSRNYSVRYEIWFDDLVSSYNEINQYMGNLQTEVIVNHEFLIGERVPDEDEAQADAEAEAEAKKAHEEAVKAYEEKLAKAVSYAQRKGTYNANFEADFRAKYYPAEETAAVTGDGDYSYTKYTSDDGSIVRVTYSNGTRFILNYNSFEVTVENEGKTLSIPAYGFIVE